MYQANGVYYSEEHSVSFGELSVIDETHNELIGYNTWTDWHMIPSSKPVIANPGYESNYIEKVGKAGVLDLSDFYSPGTVTYGLRSGSLSFIIDTNRVNPYNLHRTLIAVLHGKKKIMVLQDDPNYYYEGYFTIGPINSSESYPIVSITYQLFPYKRNINPSKLSITVSGSRKNYTLTAYDYPFTPEVTWVSGSVTTTFGGVSVTSNSAGTKTLGKAPRGNSTLTANGTGTVKVIWRGGSI